MAAQDTYRAAIIIEKGHQPKFEIQELPRPDPGPNEVLVRLHVTSICGSDCGQAAGELGPTRSILGHEGVGRIASLGANVSSIDPSVQVGQRVGVAWTRDACGSCEFCTDLQNDGETRCARAFHSGRVVDGTFAEYTVVPVRYLTRIPERFDDIPDEQVAPVLCGGVTAYKAVKCCGVVPGQWIAVSGGGGGVGAFAVAYARAMGYRVIALDAGKEKGGYSLAQGAEHYIDITATDDAGEEVKKLTNGVGAKAVIVAAGVGAAYRAAFSMLGPFGTLMCVGIPPPDHLVNFHPVFFVSKGWRVLGSAVGTRTDILEALEFVKRKLVTPKIQWGKFEDIASLLVDVAQGKIQGKYVVKLVD